MVYAADLNSAGHCGCAGSSPVPCTFIFRPLKSLYMKKAPVYMVDSKPTAERHENSNLSGATCIWDGSSVGRLSTSLLMKGSWVRVPAVPQKVP